MTLTPTDRVRWARRLDMEVGAHLMDDLPGSVPPDAVLVADVFTAIANAMQEMGPGPTQTDPNAPSQAHTVGAYVLQPWPSTGDRHDHPHPHRLAACGTSWRFSTRAR